MKETDNPYLKELIELPGTLQAKADSTVKCYSLSWQRWKKWSMEKLGKCELPANPVHVALYLQDLIKDAQEKIDIRTFNFFKNRMVIFVPKRKNDQHREGHFSNIR